MKKLTRVAFLGFIAISLFSFASTLPQKVVVVTGVSQGLGLAIANKLAHAGYMVYGTVRATSDTHVVEQIVAESGGNIKLVTLDVTDESSIQSAVDFIISEAGRIDVLINNACAVFIGTCETCTVEEQQRAMDVTYFGVVRMLQAVLPHMRKQQSGHVIAISSIAGFTAFPIIESYVASKFALEGLFCSLAIYLERWNIDVSLIEPGGIKTNVAFASPKGTRRDEAAHFDAFCEAGHQGMKDSFDLSQDPEEIAGVVAQVISEAHPRLRYQTDASSQAMAQTYFKDPTGMTAVAQGRSDQEGLLRLLN